MKKTNDYEIYNRYADKMTISDHLSVDRTELANERTLLAYLRTVITFIVAGITLGQILRGSERIYVLIILFVSALLFAVYGIYNYKKVAKKLEFDRRPSSDS